MFRIESKIDTKSADFKENAKSNKSAHAIFKERLEQVKPGGPEN